ncbi:nucleotidyltransferase domain-containing protein [Candidatus Tisiphia endosymbiont of Mystacides longicornis]|uniref:nucleotidyltransferase domain-containing protein n=1 Tax=Candidatus Tisiphia endosymbiont of Mystacides longicornis TaxID=3139330 RepID=UPI003CCAB960
MKVQDYKFYNDLISQNVVEEIWLFGSRARNDNQDRADIDLAIICPNVPLRIG